MVGAGTSQTICSLSNFIQQNVQFIYFVIKPTSLTKNDSVLFSNPILNFSLVSASGENINGNSVITPAQSLLVFNRLNTAGFFSADSVYGNVFTIFFTSDVQSTINLQGGVYGSKLFIGSESLIINYTTPLLVPHQLDIYASCTSIYKQTTTGMTKLVV